MCKSEIDFQDQAFSQYAVECSAVRQLKCFVKTFLPGTCPTSLMEESIHGEFWLISKIALRLGVKWNYIGLSKQVSEGWGLWIYLKFKKSHDKHYPTCRLITIAIFSDNIICMSRERRYSTVEAILNTLKQHRNTSKALV